MVKKMRRQLAKYRNLAYVKIVSRKLMPDKFFVCNRGIGDTVIFLSRLKEYYEVYHKKVNIIIPENQYVLVQPYQKYIKRVEVKSIKEVGRIIAAIWENDSASKNLQFILPPRADKLLEGDITLFDLVGNILNLNGTEFERPFFKWEDGKREQLFSQLEIVSKKFAIIAPEAVTVKNVSKDYWKYVVERYHDEGLIVLENGSAFLEPTFGDKKVFVGLDEMYLLAEDAVSITSVRSGLSDLLAYTSTPMTVVYPDTYSYKLYSFKGMPFAGNVIEIVYGGNT